MQAFRAGFTSIMIDGSHSVFEENIAITKSVVDVCHSAFVPVEAELGKVGGKEDDLDGGSGGYTDPAEAAEFVERLCNGFSYRIYRRRKISIRRKNGND